MNEGTFFLFRSEGALKTDEGGPEKQLFFFSLSFLPSPEQRWGRGEGGNGTCLCVPLEVILKF